MRILRTAVLTVAGGVLMAYVLFNLTAPGPMAFMGPGTTVTDPGVTNPWTGELRPMIIVVPDMGASGQVTSTRTYEEPDDWRDIRVIPLPVGFAVGSLLTFGFITLARRRRTTPTTAASPA